MINTVNFSGYDGNFCTGLDYGCNLLIFQMLIFVKIYFHIGTYLKEGPI